MMPLSGDLRTPGDRDDSGRNGLVIGIDTTIADDVVGRYVRYRLS